MFTTPYFHGWDSQESQLALSAGIQGSCWCGQQDSYCLCTPSLAIDVICISIDTTQKSRPIDSVVLIRRKRTPLGLAIPGGFVDVGETAERAAVREFAEETSIELNQTELHQFHFYSDPKRDPRRRHTVSLTFFAAISKSRMQKALGGDDAASAVVLSIAELLAKPTSEFAFDHLNILMDFLHTYETNRCALSIQ